MDYLQDWVVEEYLEERLAAWLGRDELGAFNRL
jgi:hypothetical protein